MAFTSNTPTSLRLQNKVLLSSGWSRLSVKVQRWNEKWILAERNVVLLNGIDSVAHKHTQPNECIEDMMQEQWIISADPRPIQRINNSKVISHA